MLINRLKRVVLIFTFAAFLPSFLAAQEIESLEDERTKQLEEMGVLLPSLSSIRELSGSEFEKPLDQQNSDTLEEIADVSNTLANLVGKLLDGYNDYIRDNSRYDFVLEEVRAAPITTELGSLDTELKTMRNIAYLNLGKIALNESEEMKAFLYFNDAYRLAVFSCSDGVENCVRYEAEQFMKELLGVEGESYVHWQR